MHLIGIPLTPKHTIALFTLMQVGRRGYDPVVRTSIAYGIAKLGRRAWTNASLARDARRSAVSTNRMACWSKKLDIICRRQGEGKRMSKKKSQVNGCLHSAHLEHTGLRWFYPYLLLPFHSSNHICKTKNECSSHFLHSDAEDTLNLHAISDAAEDLWSLTALYLMIPTGMLPNLFVITPGLVFGLQHSGLYSYLAKNRMKMI